MDAELRALVDKAMNNPTRSLSGMTTYTGRELLIDYYHDMDRATATKLAALYNLVVMDTEDTVCGFKVLDTCKDCGCPWDCTCGLVAAV